MPRARTCPSPRSRYAIITPSDPRMTEAGSDTNAAVADAETPERPPRQTSPERIVDAVEAVLFSSARPVRERDLAELLDATPAAVSGALARLAEAAGAEDRGIRVEKVAGGW